MMPCVSKRGVFVRGFAVRIPNTSRFTYHCPEGHTQTNDVNARKPGRQHVGEAALSMYERWWSKEAGGVSFYCRKCSRD